MKNPLDKNGQGVYYITTNQEKGIKMNAANLINILETTAYNFGISLEELQVCAKHIDGWIYDVQDYDRDYNRYGNTLFVVID